MTGQASDQLTYRRLVAAILFAYAVLALQSAAVITTLGVVLVDIGHPVDVGIAMSLFLSASLIGMSAGGMMCSSIAPGVVVLAALLFAAIGLCLSGLAQGLTSFLVLRIVQGIGVGASVVAMYFMIGSLFTGHKRARLFGAVSTAWILPAIVGPWIAGASVQQLGWRPVYLLGGIALGLAGALVYWSARGLRAIANESGVVAIGAALVAGLALAGLQVLAARPQGLAFVGIVVCGGLIVLAAYWLLPPATLSLGRGAPAGVALRGLLAGAFFGVEAWMPLMLIERNGFTPAQAGLAVGCGGLAWVLGVWRHSRHTSASNSDEVRTLIVACGAITLGIAGVGALALSGGPAVLLSVFWSVACFGMGLGLPMVSTLVFEFSSVREYASASAGLQTSDALGCALVVVVCGVLFSALHESTVSGAYGAVFVTGGAFALIALAAAPRAVLRERVLT